MGKFKSLAGDTIIYGGGTILVRLLNWLLMPYYIRTMTSIEFGVVTQMYSYIAILLVVLTYGFETTFFRFVRKDSINKVFTTALSSITSTGIIFLIAVLLFKNELSGLSNNDSFISNISIVAYIVFIDAISAIIFAKIRFEDKTIRFALLKLLNVIILIFFNLLFLYWIPNIFSSNLFYNSVFYLPGANQSSYVFLANLFASISVLILLIPDVLKNLGSIDFSLLKRMYKYSYPILIVGITGMINQNLDKILIPKLIKGGNEYSQLAIYGANFKIGVLMAMFTQSFRLAFEPFFFKHHKETNDNSIYSKILNYFTIFGLLIFLGVTFFIDVINIVLTNEYESGNVIIPIVLIAQLLSGIYFTLSVWYKVSDKTIYGAYMGIIGSTVTILSNILLIPYIGYIGAAISGLLCFMVMVVMSIFLGKRIHYIPYNWSSIFRYIIVAALIYFIGMFLVTNISNSISDKYSTIYNIINYIMRIGLIIVFLGFVYIKEFKKIEVKIDENKGN